MPGPRNPARVLPNWCDSRGNRAGELRRRIWFWGDKEGDVFEEHDPGDEGRGRRHVPAPASARAGGAP